VPWAACWPPGSQLSTHTPHELGQLPLPVSYSTLYWQSWTSGSLTAETTG
jgi:hypothetical protein